MFRPFYSVDTTVDQRLAASTPALAVKFQSAGYLHASPVFADFRDGVPRKSEAGKFPEFAPRALGARAGRRAAAHRLGR
jgi:hypothetical protein